MNLRGRLTRLEDKQQAELEWQRLALRNDVARLIGRRVDPVEMATLVNRVLAKPSLISPEAYNRLVELVEIARQRSDPIVKHLNEAKEEKNND